VKRPIILDGPAFDWAEGERYSQAAVDDDSNVDWMAAMWADPGIMSCPGCSVHLWAEGHTAKCPECGHEWRTRDGLRHDEQAAKRAQREASR